jgi:hypothetical protein
MHDLFESPIKTKYIRKGIVAKQYQNGCINIDGIKYFFYSMTGAIQKYRKDFPKRY